jgi:hypothetical protein
MRRVSAFELWPRRELLLWGLALCALVAAACSKPPDPPERTQGRWRKMRPARAGALASADDEEALERLRSIGYVGGSIAESRHGVTVAKEAGEDADLNFYTSGHGAEAILMDMRGRVLHRWRRPFLDVWPGSREARRQGSTWWRRAYLFENGDVLAIFEGLGIIKVDRNSRLLWASPDSAHHDLAVLPGGDIYVLTRRVRRDLPSFEGTLIFEDSLCVLGADGTEKRRISLLQALEKSPFRSVLERRKKRVGDILHTNTVHVLDGRLAGRIPAFRRGSVLTSMNNLGLLAVLDPDREEITWARKRPPRGQHDPRILDTGHLLFFDNQRGRGVSAVREIDLVADQEVWAYRGTTERPFYSATCGAAQRLRNGNTLVTESDAGRAFEVDAAGEVVWEFYNPERAGPNGEYIAAISEMKRIPREHVAAWLSR